MCDLIIPDIAAVAEKRKKRVAGEHCKNQAPPSLQEKVNKVAEALGHKGFYVTLNEEVANIFAARGHEVTYSDGFGQFPEHWSISLPPETGPSS